MQKDVITYYLEMESKDWFIPKPQYKEKMDIRFISNDVFQQWTLFVGVGLPWRWYSRLKWSPAEWNEYFKASDPKCYLAFSENKLVGYFELVMGEANVLEIRFLGLFPFGIENGLGGYLLSHALDVAWGMGAQKVWLHTCTSDHKSALHNYVARGFRIKSQTEEMEEIPLKEEYLKDVTDFMSQYIDLYKEYWN
ncbi:MAG TPA: GNAT family N-acetyltransferase [Bacteroidales bacterium]|nr:GNAT family N-acetyltransferase [Bacteroidales bacterium]